MNIFYRWLPDGPSQFSYHEDHARSKVQDVYPDACFERADDAGAPEHHIVLAWADAAARQRADLPIAEIRWMN